MKLRLQSFYVLFKFSTLNHNLVVFSNNFSVEFIYTLVKYLRLEISIHIRAKCTKQILNPLHRCYVPPICSKTVQY